MALYHSLKGEIAIGATITLDPATYLIALLSQVKSNTLDTRAVSE